MNLRHTFSALWITGMSSLSYAAQYYVSPQGNDNGSGSAESPWRSVQASVDKLQPGDTATLLPGVYQEKVQIHQSGSAQQRITLQGQPGAVLSGKGADGANLLLIENQSHWTIQGIEFRDNLRVKDGSGIRLEGNCDDIQIRKNRIHEIRGKDAMGITVYGTNGKDPISQIVIDGNEIFNCEPARSEALTLNGNITDFAVTNNRVHDVNNIGIDFIAGESWVNGSPDAAGIYVDGARNILIEKNIVTQCDLGIEVGSENKGTVTTNVMVENNTVFHNDKAGIVFGGYEDKAGRVKQCVFKGNTLFKNHRHKSDHNGEIWIQWASDNVVTANTVIGGEESPLVQMDPGGTKNVLTGNKYSSTAGKEDAPFMLKFEDVEGMNAWIKSSGQDRDSVFGTFEISLPAIE
jgi:parallel beta-helix repeat protein